MNDEARCHINKKGIAAPCEATQRACQFKHVNVNLPAPYLKDLLATVNKTDWSLGGRLTEEEQINERFDDLQRRADWLHKEYAKTLRDKEELQEIEEQKLADQSNPVWLGSTEGQTWLKRKEIEDNDGYHEFDALFDNEGKLLNAKKARTAYGTAWMIFDSEDEEQRDIKEWFNPSNAQTASRAEANNRKKGFYVGTTEEKAYVIVESVGMPYTGQVQKHIKVLRETREPGEVRIKDNGLT